MYRCESWTIMKAEHWKTDAFEWWYWRRLLRVPWTARQSNQSILKEISPGCSLKGLMLKQKHQYFGHLAWRTNSLEETLMLGKIEVGEESKRGWDGWMALLTQWTWVWTNSRRQWRTGSPSMLQYTGSQRVRHNRVTEQQQPVLLPAKRHEQRTLVGYTVHEVAKSQTRLSELSIIYAGQVRTTKVCHCFRSAFIWASPPLKISVWLKRTWELTRKKTEVREHIKQSHITIWVSDSNF